MTILPSRGISSPCYPNGLQGEEIPLEGRIVMLADQYDALRSQRVYKTALDHNTSWQTIVEGGGQTHPSHFDPKVLQAFIDTSDQFAAIYDSTHNNCLQDIVGFTRIKKIIHDTSFCTAN